MSAIRHFTYEPQQTVLDRHRGGLERKRHHHRLRFRKTFAMTGWRIGYTLDRKP